MEKVLINYQGCTGGDFVRSCLWILKNPEHNLYIKENRLMLDDKWLFWIKPNGQVEPNPNTSILMNLLRWPNLEHNRRNNLKLYSNWQYNINYEYKIQSKQRAFDSKILNSNVDIQITHDPFEFHHMDLSKMKELIDERDRCLETLFEHKWNNVYWIFNTSIEDMAWSMYFNSVKNQFHIDSYKALIREILFRLARSQEATELLKISNNKILSHNDVINNKIHDFFKLKPTAIYMKWYKLYSISNNLPNPPKEYFEFLEKVTYIWNNQSEFWNDWTWRD